MYLYALVELQTQEEQRVNQHFSAILHKSNVCALCSGVRVRRTIVHKATFCLCFCVLAAEHGRLDFIFSILVEEQRECKQTHRVVWRRTI